jgi:hypothetical protein
MVTITAEHIEQLRTLAGGGFPRRPMEILNCWPLTAGWQQRLIGVSVSNKTWKEAVSAAKLGPIYRRRGNTR